jgi:quercetin dioxygenase-like cupin family protein
MAFEFFQSLTGSDSKLDIPNMGLELTVRLPQSASGGELIVMETVNAPGFGPPLHRHHETEVFRVLEGRYLYEVDGRRFYAAAGDLVSVPGGAAHTFTNVSGGPSRQLVLMLPAMDAVAFFSGLGKLMAAGRPDMPTLNAFGAPWGVEFLGPPIHETSPARGVVDGGR